MTDIRLVVCDLDGTLIPFHGSGEASHRFARYWHALPRDRRPVLCYNSGRLLDDLERAMQDAGLPRPDYLIGGVGTAILDVAALSMLDAYQERFHEGWDRERIDGLLLELGAERQPEYHQDTFKSSWYLYDATPEDIEALREQLREQGLQVQVVYSSDRDLDVLPLSAGKGNAVQWLCEQLGIGTAQTLVAGDTGNDADMFALPGVKGVLVANATHELRAAVRGGDCYLSDRPGPDGVIEALARFGIVP